WATVSTDGGLSFVPNVQVGTGTSSANAAWTGINQDYGDHTGLVFYGGKFYPAWSDNSNSTGDNPPDAFSFLDIYTAAVPLTVTGGDRPTAPASPTRPMNSTLRAQPVGPRGAEALALWSSAGVGPSVLADVQDHQVASPRSDPAGIASNALGRGRRKR